MDHDADHTHLTKLKIFRDDFLVLSGLTMEQFHEMAERRRAEIKDGADVDKKAGAALPLEKRPPDGSDRILTESDLGQLHDLSDHVKELSETVSKIQQDQEMLAGEVEAAKPAVLWVEGNQTALEALLTGSHAAAEAITEAGAADTASGDKTAQAGSTTAPVAGSGA